MLIDPAADRTMRARLAPRAPRSPWMQLLAAVLGLAGGRAELLRHTERAWASATFSGTRHTISLCFAGAEAIAAGEHFIDALPEHEFAIRGQLVADAAVLAVDHVLDGPRLTLEVELLLLDDA